MVGVDWHAPSAGGFPLPRMAHPHASTGRKTRVPASSSLNELGQSLHLSSAAHLISCIDRCMAGGLLSSAIGSNDGVGHPSCGIVLHPAGMERRHHEYAIRGGHLSDTFGYRRKTHCGLIFGKHRIRLDFPRMLSVHSDVA